ncbi:hypothetical protein HOY82DRAFT_634161 [Tuber indicum]|nr:hypothetical protein HOY82DRAFT_634161 [Tuber indicum]
MQTTTSDDYGDTILPSTLLSRQIAPHESVLNVLIRTIIQYLPLVPQRGDARWRTSIKTVEGLGEYKNTVHQPTWNTVLRYASELRGYNGGQTEEDPERPPTKIAIFSARVANPEVRFEDEKQSLLIESINPNADRYWYTPGGPLAPGGADMVVTNDPQLPGLVPLIRKGSPRSQDHLPIPYQSPQGPGGTSWYPSRTRMQWIREYVKEADVFITHPVDKFVPNNVPFNMIGSMPACTDWLDGLNKPWENGIPDSMTHSLHNLCNARKMLPPQLLMYDKLYTAMMSLALEQFCPDRFSCGHGVIDDQYAEIAFAETTELLKQSRYVAISKDMVVARIEPSAHRFKVKVSEVLHHGTPIVATRAGGIPLQIEHGTPWIARCDQDGHARMHAEASVSDQVETVTDAAHWLYLIATLARGVDLHPQAQ